MNEAMKTAAHIFPEAESPNVAETRTAITTVMTVVSARTRTATMGNLSIEEQDLVWRAKFALPESNC